VVGAADEGAAQGAEGGELVVVGLEAVLAHPAGVAGEGQATPPGGAVRVGEQGVLGQVAAVARAAAVGGADRLSAGGLEALHGPLHVGLHLGVVVGGQVVQVGLHAPVAADHAGLQGGQAVEAGQGGLPLVGDLLRVAGGVAQAAGVDGLRGEGGLEEEVAPAGVGLVEGLQGGLQVLWGGPAADRVQELEGGVAHLVSRRALVEVVLDRRRDLVGEVEHDGRLHRGVEPAADPGQAAEAGGGPRRGRGRARALEVDHPLEGGEPGADGGGGEAEGAQVDGEGLPIEAAVDQLGQGQTRGQDHVGAQDPAHEARLDVAGQVAVVGHVARVGAHGERPVGDEEVGGHQPVEELVDARPVPGLDHHRQLLEEQGEGEVGHAGAVVQGPVGGEALPLQGPVGAAVAGEAIRATFEDVAHGGLATAGGAVAGQPLEGVEGVGEAGARAGEQADRVLHVRGGQGPLDPVQGRQLGGAAHGAHGLGVGDGLGPDPARVGQLVGPQEPEGLVAGQGVLHRAGQAAQPLHPVEGRGGGADHVGLGAILHEQLAGGDDLQAGVADALEAAAGLSPVGLGEGGVAFEGAGQRRRAHALEDFVQGGLGAEQGLHGPGRPPGGEAGLASQATPLGRQGGAVHLGQGGGVASHGADRLGAGLAQGLAGGRVSARGALDQRARLRRPVGLDQADVALDLDQRAEHLRAGRGDGARVGGRLGHGVAPDLELHQVHALLVLGLAGEDHARDLPPVLLAQRVEALVKRGQRVGGGAPAGVGPADGVRGIALGDAEQLLGDEGVVVVGAADAGAVEAAQLAGAGVAEGHARGRAGDVDPGELDPVDLADHGPQVVRQAAELGQGHALGGGPQGGAHASFGDVDLHATVRPEAGGQATLAQPRVAGRHPDHPGAGRFQPRDELGQLVGPRGEQAEQDQEEGEEPMGNALNHREASCKLEAAAHGR
jgi:hypothetical protein